MGAKQKFHGIDCARLAGSIAMFEAGGKDGVGDRKLNPQGRRAPTIFFADRGRAVIVNPVLKDAPFGKPLSLVRAERFCSRVLCPD